MDNFVPCPECEKQNQKGFLLPLSDYSFESPKVAITYRFWVCSRCTYEVGMRSGKIYRGAFQSGQEKPR